MLSYLVNYAKKEKVPNKSFCVNNDLFCIKSLHKSVLFWEKMHFFFFSTRIRKQFEKWISYYIQLTHIGTRYRTQWHHEGFYFEERFIAVQGWVVLPPAPKFSKMWRKREKKRKKKANSILMLWSSWLSLKADSDRIRLGLATVSSSAQGIWVGWNRNWKDESVTVTDLILEFTDSNVLWYVEKRHQWGSALSKRDGGIL